VLAASFIRRKQTLVSAEHFGSLCIPAERSCSLESDCSFRPTPPLGRRCNPLLSLLIHPLRLQSRSSGRSENPPPHSWSSPEISQRQTGASAAYWQASERTGTQRPTDGQARQLAAWSSRAKIVHLKLSYFDETFWPVSILASFAQYINHYTTIGDSSQLFDDLVCRSRTKNKLVMIKSVVRRRMYANLKTQQWMT
jgi:hypothetical protein